MAVVWMTVGATTPDGATFATKVSGGGPVRVAVSTSADMTSPVFTGSQSVNAQGVAKVAITGLAASTRYWWQVEDNSVPDTSVTGQFLTHPPLGVPGTFTIAFSGDSGLTPDYPGVAGGELDPSRVSNHPIHDTIRQRALAEDWLMWWNLGDWGYPDWSTGLTESLANRRTFHDNQVAQPRQGQLHREVAYGYVWDDHDYANNDSDGSYASKTNAAVVYREVHPHYPLPNSDAIYHPFQIGRVAFFAFDCRYFRSPNSDPDGPSKTMLGSAQLNRLEELFATSDAQLFVWLMGSQWAGTSSDSWASFAVERQAIVDMAEQHGKLGRIVCLGADAHMVALDTGSPISAGGIPILQAASLDATPTGDPSRYDLGGQSGRAQFGTLTVADLGTHLTVTLTGWRDTTALVSHTFAVAGDPPAPASSGALLRTLSGSHTALVEARLVTVFQTGDDPDGVPLTVLDGDVYLDATAEVQRTLSLTVAGVDGSGRPVFPRRATDPMAPYGSEVFVRRGVDLGGAGTLWTPLGYFRIDSVEQDDAPDGPIRITGSDRTAGIIDGRPVAPIEFAPTRTAASVFAELVREIYPDAVILFDGSGSTAIGRTVVVEESRHKPLTEIATALGKVMHWDGSGVLRVRTVPDEQIPVWEVNAGRGGVLVSAGRRLSRERVYNGVVAVGEGGESDAPPARAVAVDSGPTSPTRWGGPFGRVPRFYASPFLATDDQAEVAAREMLRRSLGAPYSVDFGAVVNPTLQPWDPIRVAYSDGTREVHVVERLTIPLLAERPMAASTKERTLVVIGSQV